MKSYPSIPSNYEREMEVLVGLGTLGMPRSPFPEQKGFIPENGNAVLADICVVGERGKGLRNS